MRDETNTLGLSVRAPDAKILVLSVTGIVSFPCFPDFRSLCFSPPDVLTKL